MLLIGSFSNALTRGLKCFAKPDSNESMPQITYHKSKPYFSTLTKRYYPTYDAAFQDSLRNGGGAQTDFNLYLVHPEGNTEIVF
jgi:hypothetical protein